MATKKRQHVKITVPGTTSNFGPGFDAFGAALNVYNTVEVRLCGDKPENDFVGQAAAVFFREAGIDAKKVEISVKGNVPRSRGLGSSVTVRAAVVCGLNKIFGKPLSREQCLQIVTKLEGHPDNATPAFLGGFTICCEKNIFQTPIGSELRFVTLVPDFEVETAAARRLLPKSVLLADAVSNVRHASIVAAAFATGNYALLRGAFQDHFHQPYRKKLIPGFDKLEEASFALGALGFFLSGSGSTVIALAEGSRSATKIGKSLSEIWKKSGVSSRLLQLRAHNEALEF